MTIEDIKQLISKDENRALELKKTTGELKEGMHTACDFLNTDGGWLIFGIVPHSLKIIGQEVTDCTQGGFVIITFRRVLKDSSTPQVPPKYPSSTPQVPSKYHPSSIQVETLIKTFCIEYMSIPELMEAIGIRDRKYFRENYVTPALNDGAIERKFPEQPTHPHQLYRLTEKAKKWK